MHLPLKPAHSQELIRLRLQEKAFIRANERVESCAFQHAQGHPARLPPIVAPAREPQLDLTIENGENPGIPDQKTIHRAIGFA